MVEVFICGNSSHIYIGTPMGGVGLDTRSKVREKAVIKVLNGGIEIIGFKGFGKIIAELSYDSIKLLRLIGNLDFRSRGVREVVERFLRGEIGLEECYDELLTFTIASKLKR